jgi:hypothetical protein
MTDVGKPILVEIKVLDLPEVQELIAKFEEEVKALRGNVRFDDPDLDGTDFAHPAFLRGEDYAMKMFCQKVGAILDGSDTGIGVHYEPFETLRRRLLDLMVCGRQKNPF